MTVRRFKSDDELSVAEITQRQAARRQGQPPPRFETPEYRTAREQALADAGLDSDDAAAPPLDEMTVQQHIERQARRR